VFFCAHSSSVRYFEATVESAALAWLEKERRGRMPQGMSGNDWHPCALAGELEACVERLVAKRRAVPTRKDERRSREVDSPTPPQPHAETDVLQYTT
jgi:hypothetical protein